MQREIMDKLIQWKDSKRRKPLLLTGVRQGGHTRKGATIVFIHSDTKRGLTYEMETTVQAAHP